MGKRKMSRVNMIENAGPNSLKAFLEARLPSATQVDIAAAFVTQAGLNPVLHLLHRAAARGRVRLLTGLYECFTEPQALRTLLRVQQQTAGRLSVRLSTGKRFHWKAYLIRRRSSSTAVVGSSNLTVGGLWQDGELNVVLSSAAHVRALYRAFEKAWGHRSVGLHPAQVERYARYRSAAGVTARARSVPLSRILGAAVPHKPIEGQRYWRAYVDGTLSHKTEQVLHETTNWSESRYYYFNTGQPRFAVGDRAVLFDFVVGRVEVVRIRDVTETPQATPDGRHFAAYTCVHHVPRRRMTRRRWAMFKASGLLMNQAASRRDQNISRDRFEQFLEVLRTG